ncbi:RNA polymerase-associated protein RapA [Corynebacterium afermentans subsp. afermentans]|uniref:SNF2 family N-terminal domain-containing protein n=1 Tax=Corynebacterium afermentans TaxID=38286 RepID=A0A9X8WIJ0_9CORY|nr:DEAD/DEAH box helicase [Corynebacterium afermentans]OAA17443.1 helicase [Corynebacterium afermentans subsp. afermentans]WJY57763.1 RNA polymerase-associated protein RapA [Corynebacterium afermentans subsp. afermentans]SIQ40387.1 SNF2 family N-terminal domain-containing protein [Corynebacterium afermentans]
MSSPTQEAAPEARTDNAANSTAFAPGLMVKVRDELWLITSVTQSVDGYLLKVRGLSDYVRDTTASFYTAIDDVEVFDPAKMEVVPDRSPGYRTTRLWLETTLRQTPVPLYQEQLSVADQMLMDPLDYQLTAVRKALSDDNLRPRVLIADAVGLGKTLEIGMILSELIRRGRGERILVVTPKHIMEQFQQELWSRFAIPLVRLDSTGIQRVRQMLPASRNPFTYFPRVIVSMDTLKSPKYRAQLEKVRWDAVVIDEIHNATNVGTQNNELARTLAPTTEALLLASATPHNGDPESFKEILRLLDPTAVLPNGEIDKDAVSRLLIRRHRHSDEVASVVGEQWAERKEPKNIPVEASAEENAVAGELEQTWIHTNANPAQDRLFPWTLVKAFLSSPAALGETIDNRLKRVPESDTNQRQALERLQTLNAKVTRQNSNKYASLVNYLQEIGVGKGKKTRAVVFSERVATLHWLKEHLTKDLKMPAAAVAVMHGGLSDEEQMRLVDEFKREDSKLRILITGDVASEGVNLHTLCHNLIHYDIPWSLIRIQQRNGRVDRYGQTEPPQIAALLLDTKQGGYVGELHVLAKLINRENEAHALLGDVGSLIGKHTINGEEEEIRKVIQNQAGFDDVVKTPEQIANTDAESEEDLIDFWLSGFGLSSDPSDTPAPGQTVAPAHTTSLYASEISYLEDALKEAFYGAPEKPLGANGVAYELGNNGVAELAPPEDLCRRLDILPQDYLADRKVREKFLLATNTAVGNTILRNARTGQDGSTWPKAHFLGPLHPVTDWAADRALASLSAGQITAIAGEVDMPTVLLMATLTNKRGQVVSRAFVTVAGGMLPKTIEDPVAWLRSVGLTENAINPETLTLPDNAQELVASSVEVAYNQLQPMMAAARNHASQRIEYWIDRADQWQYAKDGGQTTVRAGRSANLIAEERALIASLEPDRELIRPLVLVLPKEQ